VDGIEIQKPQLRIKNQDSVVGTRIRNTPTPIENGENPTNIEILTIGSKIKNEEDPIGIEISTTKSRTKTELLTKNLCSIKILVSIKSSKSMNTGQISDPNTQ
jgi:hypothetical protein